MVSCRLVMTRKGFSMTDSVSYCRRQDAEEAARKKLERKRREQFPLAVDAILIAGLLADMPQKKVLRLARLVMDKDERRANTRRGAGRKHL